MLTDGEDTSSKLKYNQICNKIKNNEEVNLIIVGLGLNQDVIENLRYLCNLTEEGKFIESPRV